VFEGGGGAGGSGCWVAGAGAEKGGWIWGGGRGWLGEFFFCFISVRWGNEVRGGWGDGVGRVVGYDFGMVGFGGWALV